MGASRRQYTDEFKREAVELLEAADSQVESRRIPLE
jgi:transposase-like protein